MYVPVLQLQHLALCVLKKNNAHGWSAEYPTTLVFQATPIFEEFVLLGIHLQLKHA